MDIFNSNKKLEELTLFGLDWGIYNRHDIDGPIMAYMFLKNGKEQYIRTLVTDGNPLEFAKAILEKEEKPFEQFVIGFEGYLRDDNNERVDSIIVHGFDVTQEKGVTLAQMFQSKESGGFKKIGRINFLGNIDSIIPVKKIDSPDYSMEDIGFNAVAIQNDGLISYKAVFVYDNESIIVNSIKQFLRSKFGGEKRLDLRGDVEINILEVKDESFLKFLLITAVDEELESDLIQRWCSDTNRYVEVKCNYCDKLIYEKDSKNNPVQKIYSETNYENFSEEELEKELFRFFSIPDGRKDMNVLTQLSILMKEYKQRGIEMPIPNNKKTKRKSWWKFWE